MAKRKNKYIVVPTTLWENAQLTWLEKIVLIEIDSFSDDAKGFNTSIGKIANIVNIPKTEVKDIIARLYKIGAINISVDDNGDTRYTAFINKESYSEVTTEDSLPAETDDETKNAIRIDYDFILSEWKRINPTLLQPRLFTPKMQQQFRCLLKNNKCELADVIKAFRIINTSRFLMGANDRGWKATLQWLISDRNGCFQKILMGGYSLSSYAEKEAYKAIMETPTEQFVIENSEGLGYYK